MKKQKIVITGALGYIGTELAKLYSGHTRSKDIVLLDKRFVSERVKYLTDKGFTFIQTSILDQDSIKDILKDADAVIHLAGITDVAYTKTESNSEKDKEIVETAIQGTLNILNCVPKTCKIIFPSTHVVYEGFETTKFDIQEDETQTPVLTYSKSKVQNEQDIKQSGLDYIILRLGSVYGYSNDTMRINIMPNLFSKMSSQNQTIKLFGKGVQYKSLVSVYDVARCIKYFEESYIKNETYHLTNENMTVKEVAELVNKCRPTNIIETDDEIPNLGYTLSNKKLLSTGFEFLYDIKHCIKEMIDNWSPKQLNKELEYTIQGQKEFIDSRGKISNFELTEPINLIGYIESKKGSVRANHYHPIQEQKCLLISGRYISVVKDLLDPKAQIQTQIINPGDISIIKPNVAHTMVFLEDSVFLNLVNGEREHENYGITHTIPYKLVDEDARLDLLQNYKTKCRVSNSNNLKPVISLGLSPLANNLLDSVDEKTELFPLEMMYCPVSHNCQLSYTVPADKMFKNYLYLSSTTKTFRDHFIKAAEKYISYFNLNSSSLVVDIGSNDGISLKPLKDKGIRVLGVEPAVNVAELANKEGIETICNYFNSEVVYEIVNRQGKADLVTASNVFAHSDYLEEIANAAFRCLKIDGSFVVEVQYLLNTIKDLTFDNIYHEHVNYWSVLSINNFFNRLGYSVYDVEHINTHGGSIRVYVDRGVKDKSENVQSFINNELAFGLDKYQTYLEFRDRVYQAKENINKNIQQFKDQGLKIVGFGSPAKATTSLNFFGITNEEIDYIIEDNPLKHNKVVPGVNIPIYSRDKINEQQPDIIIVLAWNFFEDIKKNNQELIDKGIRFINIKDLM